MAVSLTALVIALGGSAYAASSMLDGAKLKNGSVTGGKLKKDTLTGKQIKESTLGTVPSALRATNATHASTADSATNAGNASALGAVPASGYVQGGGRIYTNGATESESTSDTQVMTIPGLGVLSMGCSPSGSTDYELSNATGDSVQVSDTGNYFLVGTGNQTESGGKTARPSDFLSSDLGLRNGQFVLTFVWPAGASTQHGAELNIGWYLDNVTSKCTLNVTGFIH
jgi:hypothetical protein